MGSSKKARTNKPGPAPAAAARTEFQAEKLTGKRAQKGGRGGSVVFTYEVQWKNGPGGKKYANTFEPADCLIGWEAEMKKVDEQIVARSKQAFLKPLQVQRAAREHEAHKKAEELTAQSGTGCCASSDGSRGRSSPRVRMMTRRRTGRTLTTSCCLTVSSSTVSCLRL